MTRVEVETLLGPPGADDVSPVFTADGRTTYRMAYELADPDTPPTVRPLTAGRNRLPPHPVEVRLLGRLGRSLRRGLDGRLDRRVHRW